MTTTMLGSYSNSSGVGVETRCLNFNMHWDGFPLTSKFYFKLVQWKDELIPKAYIKKEIFTLAMAPEWFNDRKIANFKFGFIRFFTKSANSLIENSLGFPMLIGSL